MRWSVIVIVSTAAFIALGSVRVAQRKPATPDGAVQALFAAAKVRNWDGAFDYLANNGETKKSDFIADLAGRDASLRNYSSLETVDTTVLHRNENEALVRAGLRYYSSVGSLNDTRDLKVIREGNEWKVVWPVEEQPKVPPQVIPVNYLRWDVVYRGAQDDWGAQDAAPPKVRITSMNAIENQGSTIVLGEIVNDDVVPGFISVNATLLGKSNEILGEETAFDRILHTLLPKEVSPFRIDFPGVPLAAVKNVRMTPTSLLVPAAADPVIAVTHQRLTTDDRGQHELAGELVNQGGETVNIPHVLVVFYDNSGRVIWVSDRYVEQALLPTAPVPFTVSLANDLAGKVQSYRVVVNTFSWNHGA